MANRKEQTELFRTIWAIANDLRGAVDGWTFKAYVLGAIFYRYISEDICQYVAELQAAAGVHDFDYSAMSDEEAETAHEMIVDEKGYFILPSQLFKNVLKTADDDENLNEHLGKIFRAIETSPGDKPSKEKIAGLFSDFAVDNTMIGNTVGIRNKLLAKLLKRVDEMDLSQHLEDNRNDTFGDAYEFLMKMYASQAGKSGGEFFTPQEVSELIAEIAAWGTEDIKRVYDPACGSGSLLLKFQKIHGRNLEGLKFYGQEINPTTFNLCRSNMFLHHVNYNDFDIALDDTLLFPAHIGMVKDGKGCFDCIVSNPPYSLKWVGKENPLLMNDPRYADAGILAPASAADLAFVLHMYYHLKETGCCAIVEFPGVLYRSGAEKKIREYLLKENAIDTVIQLPENLFYGVTISTCIIVLKKQGRRAGDDKVLFIDASREFYKDGNKNYLSEINQKNILSYYTKREDVQYVSKLVKTEDIIANDSILSVSSYVEQEDCRVIIEIDKVNTHIDTIAIKNNESRLKITSFLNDYNTQIELFSCVDTEWKSFEELGFFFSGLTGKTKKDFLDGNSKFITYMNIFTNPELNEDAITGMVKIEEGEKQNKIQKGDILFTGSSETPDEAGMSCVITTDLNEDYYMNSFCFGVRLYDQSLFNLKYLKHLLRSVFIRKEISKAASGVTRFNISKSRFAKIKLPIPTLEKQKLIADSLELFVKSVGELGIERDLRQKQYEYYREKLLTFE